MRDRPYFDVVPFEQIDLVGRPPDLIKGLVPNQGLTLVYGAPKVGKSFITFDMMMHVAMGKAYCGRPVIQGPVVYVAAEGEYGFRARVAAFRKHHMGEEV